MNGPLPDDMRPRAVELIDVADRIASAVIALTNGDDEGAAAVLNGAPADAVVHLLLRVLIKTGRDGFGEEVFIRGMRAWASNCAEDLLGEQP